MRSLRFLSKPECNSSAVTANILGNVEESEIYQTKTLKIAHSVVIATDFFTLTER